MRLAKLKLVKQSMSLHLAVSTSMEKCDLRHKAFDLNKKYYDNTEFYVTIGAGLQFQIQSDEHIIISMYE